MIKSLKILDFCFECNLAAIGQKKTFNRNYIVSTCERQKVFVYLTEKELL